MNVTIKKHHSLVAELPGTGTSKFHGFAYDDGKRCGTVWKWNDGWYVCNEDFDTRKHSNANRPRQWKGRTLAELKANMNA